MKKGRKILVPLLLLGPRLAMAQELQTAEDFFNWADSSGDGTLTGEEYEPVGPGYSYEEVAGSDGEVSLREYRDAFDKNVFTSLSGLRHLDQDGNEALSRREYGEGELALGFDEIDINGDDSVNTAELSLALARLSTRGNSSGNASAQGGTEGTNASGQADEAANAADARSLEARVRADADGLSKLPLLSRDGEAIGTVETFAAERESGMVYAIVSRDEGNVRTLAAVDLRRLAQVEDALVFDEPDASNRLRGQDYDGSRFERLSQPQSESRKAGGRGSLEDALQIEPNLLSGVRLVGENGEALGEVATVAVNKADQQLYVLTNGGGALSGDGGQMAVPATALRTRAEGVVLTQPDKARRFSENDYLILEELKVPLR